MTANKPEVEISEPVVAEGEVVEEAPPKVQEEKKSADGVTNEAGTSGSGGDSKEESLRKAVNALVQGKRHFFMKDIPSAIAALEESCRLQVDIYGPLSSEHAEAHFYFGRALLEQARIDLTVFDAPNAGGKSEEETSEGDDEDMEDEDGDDDEEEEDEEMAEEANDGTTTTTTTSAEANKEKLENGTAKDSTSNGDNNSKEEKDSKPAEVDDNKMEETASSTNPGSSSNTEEAKPSASSSSSSSSTAATTTTSAITANDDEKPSTSKGGDMSALAEPGEEELNNLELAWEVLEIAKIGYQKQLEQLQTKLSADDIKDEEKATLKTSLEDIKRKLADTHSYLGEVGTESEIYPQAVEDFKTALSIYSELEGADSREIAQIKFHIGVTYALEKKWKESVENLQESAEMIQLRIDNLKEKLTKLPENKTNGEATTTTTTSPASTETESERVTIEKEIQELSELLPELKEKINDTLEQEKDLKRVEEEDKMEQEVIERNSPVKKPPPAKPLDSGLIKRKEKRKIDLESVPLGQVIGGETKQAEFGTDEPPTKKSCTESTIDELPAVTLSIATNGHKQPE